MSTTGAIVRVGKSKYGVGPKGGAFCKTKNGSWRPLKSDEHKLIPRPVVQEANFLFHRGTKKRTPSKKRSPSAKKPRRKIGIRPVKDHGSFGIGPRGGFYHKNHTGKWVNIREPGLELLEKSNPDLYLSVVTTPFNHAVQPVYRMSPKK